MKIINTHFKHILLKPHWSQYIINEAIAIFLCFLCFLCNGLEYLEELNVLRMTLEGSGLFILLYLVYRILYIRSIKYIITSEQLIVEHGVFSHSTEYLELYRVIDYQQHKSFAQQLFGLKTILVLSGDRTSPIIRLSGIRNQMDIIPEIRQRVEFNKKRRGIYEITNTL